MISDRNTKSLHKGKLIYLYVMKRLVAMSGFKPHTFRL